MIRLRTWLLLAASLALSAALVLFPRFGPPAFRYTGADPNRPVWNLGWPVDTMILDPASGLHVGPGMYLVAPGLVLLFAASWAIGWAIRRVLAARAPRRGAIGAGPQA